MKFILFWNFKDFKFSVSLCLKLEYKGASFWKIDLGSAFLFTTSQNSWVLYKFSKKFGKDKILNSNVKMFWLLITYVIWSIVVSIRPDDVISNQNIFAQLFHILSLLSSFLFECYVFHIPFSFATAQTLKPVQPLGCIIFWYGIIFCY